MVLCAASTSSTNASIVVSAFAGGSTNSVLFPVSTTTTTGRQRQRRRRRAFVEGTQYCSSADTENEIPWTNLVSDDDSAPVRKTILDIAHTDDGSPQPGTTATIKYVGRLVLASGDTSNGNVNDGVSIASWTTHDVLECWLKEQQGLYELLADAFQKHSVDGAALLDETLFTEDYLLDELGLENKIKRKKTIMAAKRLRTTMGEFLDGAVFDESSSSSSDDDNDGVYKFVVGKGKTIKAMELLVASMQVGERSKVVCRADYGYGSDGYRTSQGVVVIPPFCGLEFEVTLVSVE